MVQAWIAAGKPLHATRLGSFESWSGIMGGVLEVAGIPGFLCNLNELYEAADTDGQMWREFTGTWWEAYREEPKKVGELNQFCEERDLMLSVRGDGSARSQQTRLGKALAAKRDRVFNGLTVKQSSHNNHKTGVLYALALADGPDNPRGASSSCLLYTSITRGSSGTRRSSPGFGGNTESARRRSAVCRSGTRKIASPAWRAR